ncbi:MAG: hypothetical protein EOO10_14430 [Chitinophagaceae bacterium]|nr:MAG: hypothetical protein EOO10_14430 [Chitinophagaceae bacterium]
MRFLILLLFPILGFCQTNLDTISLLSDRVKLLAPVELKSMSDEMWTAKYQRRKRPLLVLSDEDGEVNLLADMTQMAVSENQVTAFKDTQIQQLKKSRLDMVVIAEGIKTVNGKHVGYFKFSTQAVDQKVFNYYFFTSVDGKLLLFSFNSIEKLRKKWEQTADEIVSSLKSK